MASCGPIGCGEHGHCHDGACMCQRLHFGEHCEQDFVTNAGEAGWVALVTIATAIQSTCLLVAAARIGWRRMRTGRMFTSVGARDTAAWLNAGASLLRVVWFMNLASGWDVASRITNGLLLRLPQAAWLGAFGCIMLVWRDIMASAHGTTPPRRHVYWVAGGTLVVTGLTCGFTIADNAEAGGFGGNPTWRIAGDVTFTVSVALLTVLGGMAAHRLQRLARTLEDGIADLPTSEDRFRARLVLDKLMEAFRMTIISVSAAGILVLCVAIIAGTQTTPRSDPQAYLAYMYVVHCIVEPSAAVVLLVVTRQQELRRRHGAPSTTGTAASSSGAGSLATAPKSPAAKTTSAPLLGSAYGSV